MVKHPADKLRRQFSKSKLVRNAAREMLQAEGFSRRDAATLAACMGYIWESLPEPKIKLLLYAGRDDMTITEDERNEARKLLQMTTTALTRKQRRQLLSSLYCDAD